ncbi:syntaxin-10 isoform X1 [Drosophila sulfurigaster albostrigata]|uniref:Syntaxin-10 isoform X1 n=2 Tax=Drosophila albomicans TaxID=7291 RepID=A0A6P8XEN8_DROAB|nr:syntaxin-10 isoform X1 [Drosophila albomicans]XP_060658921.1 syntaxin-10 isoform X1 [Drosophila nasuta]XP_062131493.1 syntaxin-10 isoform X1 [Drosophila sulfurigaster albostrigata]
MSLEDPFFVVKDEVFKALNKTRGLYLRWRELGENGGAEVEWTTTELRNSLRSIEWDLEDLEDTISIVEKNPTKFRIDNRELSSRRHFIDNTRDEVKQMKDKMSLNRNRDRDITAHQPLLENERQSHNHNHNQSNEYNHHHHHHSHNDRTYLVDCPNTTTTTQAQSVANTIAGTMSTAAAAAAAAARHSGTKYSKLENAMDIDSPSHYGGGHGGNSLDSPGHRYVGETVSVQQRMIQGQDEQLDMISDSIGTLKTVSRQIGVELDEQAVMLDDFGNEFDTTESKLDTTMKKVAKVLHMNNDKRQWAAILILSVLLLFVIILFIIL